MEFCCTDRDLECGVNSFAAYLPWTEVGCGIWGKRGEEGSGVHE